MRRQISIILCRPCGLLLLCCALAVRVSACLGGCWLVWDGAVDFCALLCAYMWDCSLFGECAAACCPVRDLSFVWLSCLAELVV